MRAELTDFSKLSGGILIERWIETYSRSKDQPEILRRYKVWVHAVYNFNGIIKAYYPALWMYNADDSAWNETNITSPLVLFDNRIRESYIGPLILSTREIIWMKGDTRTQVRKIHEKGVSLNTPPISESEYMSYQVLLFKQKQGV
jgi:hypothetical protein